MTVISLPATKLAIAIDLGVLEALVREYIAEHENVTSDDDLYRRILLSTFILWLRKRQETMNEPQPENSSKNLQLVAQSN